MQDPNTPTPVEGTPAVDPQAPPQTAPATPTADPAPQPVKPEDTAEYWKNRYAESTREAQLILEQNRQKDQQIETLTKPHDPTDADLRAAYPEWDSMLPSEQRLARENLSLKKGHAQIQQTTAELAAEIRWSKDLKSLLKKPEFAALRGREDEFEEYVFKPTHKMIPVDTLARSFLFGTAAPSAQPVPAAPSAPTAERSSGGPAPTAKKKMSLDEAKTLRETNFEEYRRKVQAGEVDDDI